MRWMGENRFFKLFRRGGGDEGLNAEKNRRRVEGEMERKNTSIN